MSLDVGTVARIGKGALGLIFPFYAALQLGGTETALVILVAAAAGLGSFDQKPGKQSSWDGLKRALRNRKATCAAIAVAMVLHVWNSTEKQTAILGVAALASSVLIVPPPLPATGWALKTGLRNANGSITRASLPKPCSPLVATPVHSLLTLVLGLVLGLATFLFSMAISTPLPKSTYSTIPFVLAILSATALVSFSLPAALRSQKKIGLALGSLCICALGAYHATGPWHTLAYLPIVSMVFLGAVSFDTGSGITASHAHDHAHTGHNHAHKHEHRLHGEHSRISKFLIARCTPGSVLHSILIERDSRRIAYFGV